MQDIETVFSETYGKQPEYTAFTPYRLCPLGAHIDHQLGRITGFAIDKGIRMVYSPRPDGTVEAVSLQFPGLVRWNIRSTPAVRQNDWADHLRGAVLALRQRYPIRTGLCAVINGELPVGGLSSSAAVILTVLSALAKVNRITLTAEEMILLAREAENRYVGVACGKLDQSCEVYCRKDRLLYMDMQNDRLEQIPAGANMKPYAFAVFFSGLTRSLVCSGYNTRVDECKSAAYALLALSGSAYGRWEDTCLRSVPYETYLQYKDRLPENWAKRAQHWYSENSRVEAGVRAWKNGDIEEFGRLVTASGESSIHNYEAGSPELIRLHEILTHTPGVYGGRFSGAGFKGCCMAVIDPSHADGILESVGRQYTEDFPALKEKYSAHLCGTSDGLLPGSGN